MVYNDLKLDNILIGNEYSSPSSLTDVSLVDFGLCTEYLDKERLHLPNI